MQQVNSAVWQEICRRAVGNAIWAEYLLLIAACKEVWDAVPGTAEECEKFDVEEQLGADLARLARAIELILPGGFSEFKSYLDAAVHQRSSMQSL
jgi:hypothetical protein